MPQTVDQIQTLHKKLTTLQEEITFPEVPEHILSNLKSNFGNRPYQKEAFSRFLFWWESKNKTQNRFLYHMATGSGKTLIMAGLILDLYKKGYSNFLFFVHLDNIVQKTKENFLNAQSHKYLFAHTINIDGKQVKICEVDTFVNANPADINIMFTTIQGLHFVLNNTSENSPTYEDFEDIKLVLISDEAHHLQVDTRSAQTKKDEEDNSVSWEGTADRIFQSNKKENVLLEFTATAELSNPLILDKYKDVLIFDYPLAKFREDGYSKEVLTHEFDSNDKFERALQAMLLSQYRLKIFNDHNLNIKPVVMFKANYVNEPKNKQGDSVVSEIFQAEFHERLKNLSGKELQELKAGAKNIIKQAFDYFEKNKIALDDLAKELKRDFASGKCICVNTESESIDKQKEVNNLENNEYRAVFAVDKLNEGWDVLNLFDIVRLYDTRDARQGRPGKTTMREAQLIGRGARYFPFKLEKERPEDRRKYDDDLENPLRVCETMYYHSKYNPKYIEELRKALRETGLLPDKSEERELKLKESFKKTEFYKKGVYFHNKRTDYKREDIKALDKPFREKRYKYSLPTHSNREIIIMTEEKVSQTATKTETFTLGNEEHFEKKFLQKAIDKQKFFWFDNLQTYFPSLKSIDEFITSKDYLTDVKVDVTGTEEQLKYLSAEEKLGICSFVLSYIADHLPRGVVRHKGTKEFFPASIKEKFIDKKVRYIPAGNGGQGHPQSSVQEEFHLDVPNEHWYAYTDNFGTDQEKYLVKFIYSYIDKLKKKYKNVYLLRNEKIFQLYSFNDGSPFEPDFLLFLEQDVKPKKIVYQLFIEPKQEKLMTTEQEKNKENFLKEIEKGYEIRTLFKNKQYKLIGMPFYNEDAIGKKDEFEKKFKSVVDTSQIC